MIRTGLVPTVRAAIKKNKKKQTPASWAGSLLHSTQGMFVCIGARERPHALSGVALQPRLTCCRMRFAFYEPGALGGFIAPTVKKCHSPAHLTCEQLDALRHV